MRAVPSDEGLPSFRTLTEFRREVRKAFKDKPDVLRAVDDSDWKRLRLLLPMGHYLTDEFVLNNPPGVVRSTAEQMRLAPAFRSYLATLIVYEDRKAG